ncbi:MAG TPA: AAA family ATPase, partial [Kofleriaceae bacterium]|nr:AAA family ATPase [Kofleriaceae bacterium]
DRLRAALVQLVGGLDALHASGHLHQDIKPSNVLVTGDDRVVLLDFGVVTGMGEAGGEAGTPPYMAPERFGDEPRATPASDWYSVGVMLYRVLTGRKPFTGAAADMLEAKRQRDVADPRSLRLDTPDDLATLCMALLDPDPDRRPSGSTILARLRRAPSSPPVPAARRAPPLLVGRDAHLATLAGALDRSRAQCTAVFVSGASGLGKTALLRGFLDDPAWTGDAVVLSGRCYERETVPYKAVDSLIDGLYRFLLAQPPASLAGLLPTDMRLLARMFPVLEQLDAVVGAPAPAEVRNPHEVRRRGFAALRELLHRLGQHRALVLAIDDLQWGDADSSALLDALLRPPAPPPLLLVVAYRAEDAARAPAIQALLHMSREWQPGVDIVPLAVEPLAAEDAEQLAARLLERARDSSAVRAVIRESSGHPYLIHELSHLAEAAPAGGGDAQVSLEQVIARRADGLAPEARRLLELVAVADHPVPQAILEEAAGMSRAQRTTLLETLERERLVRLSGAGDGDTAGVYHDRIRELVAGRLDAGTRARHHLQLALAIQRGPAADPETLTVHFAGAGEQRRAGHYAALAARQAADALAFDRAAELYRLALRLGEHAPADARALQLELAHALGCAGRGHEAAAVFLALADTAEPLARLDYRSEAARQLMISGRIEQGLQAISSLLADTGIPYPATPRRAVAGLVWNRAWMRARGLRWTPRRADDIPAADLARADVEQSVADGLAMVDNVRGAYFQSRALRQALRLGEPSRIARALSREIVFLSSTGGRGTARAAQRLELMREIAERSSDGRARAWIHVAEGFIHYFGGRMREAQQCFEDAERLLCDQPTESTFELANARLFRLFAYRRMGEFPAGRRLLDDYLADAQRRGDLYAETSMRRACNVFWLAEDRPAEAAADLERTAWTPPATGFHLQHWYELDARCELALYTGVTEEALGALDRRFAELSWSMLTRVQFIRVLAWTGRARLLLAAPPDRARLGEVAVLARRMAGEHMGYATCWSLLVQAALAARAGDRAAALDQLTRAAALAAAGDLHAHAAVARRRRGALLGGADGTRLIDDADAWLRAHGVVDPERFGRVLAPGFEGPPC